MTPRTITIFFILTVLTIYGAGQVHAEGMAALLYWFLGAGTFLLPCIYVTHWLAMRFPGGGGRYLWATRIMGTHWGFIAAFSAWLPCVFAVISTLANSLILVQVILPSQQYSNALQPMLCLLCVIVLATFAACRPLARVQHYLFIVAALYLVTMCFVGGAGVWWLLSGHALANAWSTVLTWHGLPDGITSYGLVALMLLGVDLPMLMSGSIRETQKIPGERMHWRVRTGRLLLLGGMLVLLTYVAQAWSIAIVLPGSSTNFMPAMLRVTQMAFGPVIARVVASLLLLSQTATICVYLLIASRILLLLAQDKRLPVSLTMLNQKGVPLRSILTQTVMVIVLAVLTLVAVPVFFQQVVDPTLLSETVYVILQSSVSLLLIFSTMQLFVFTLCCLFKRGERGKLRRVRQRIVLFAASIIGILATVLGAWGTVAHSQAPALLSNEAYALIVVAVAVLSLSIAWVSCEVLRAHSLLREQRVLNDREVTLRAELQEAYNELEISVQQQNELIMEVGRLYREQAQAAITDAITGLPNHRAVMSRIDEELARCERSQSPCSILFVDIDHFKRVNDTWGHRAGDSILREVASRLRASLRLSDFVGRYGGEEFALLLPETDIVGASESAERLRLSIASQSFVWQTEDGATNIAIPVTASIGVATYGMHGVTREKLVECADKAMYHAKEGGRNRVCVADLFENNQEHRPLMTMLPLQVEATTVQVLTAAACARDRGTDDHAHRMVVLAEATARQLNLSDDDIHLVRLGALLHDIGKIGIPDAILHKPGPLTSEEWDIMRLHPQIGQRILSQAGGVFLALANIVVAHHERWDGRGYPAGLAGEQIPLASRILTVIDSYDAMTSRRVYRAAMSPLDARQELQRCAGSQYDPTVVAAFLRVLDTHDIMGSMLIPLAMV